MRQVLLILFTLLALACDGGLMPQAVEPGFGGTITFAVDTWPPPDSLVNLWLVASQDYPLDSVAVFSGIFSNPPRIFVYPSLTENLPYNVASVSYSFKLPPAEYKYIVVLQHMNQQINAKALRVVGLFAMEGSPSEPRSLTIRDNEFLENITIAVNFHQLPPQPF